MSVRSALTRLAITGAAGALATAAVITPATADDEWGNDPAAAQYAQGGGGGGDGDAGDSQFGQGGNGGNDDNDQSGHGGNGGNGGNGHGGNGNGNGGNDNGNGNGQGGNGNGNGQGGNGNGHGGNGGNGQGGNGQGGDGRDSFGNHDDQGRYRGVVTAERLLLRSAPNRGSKVIRAVHRGDVVSIYCKAPGQRVDNNPLWYLLTDGTWAWGAARYINNIGPAPRWC